MKNHFIGLFTSGIVLGFLAIPAVSASIESTPVPTKISPTVLPSRPTAPVAPSSASSTSPNPEHTLLLHKPRLPAEWGTLIQYHRETVTNSSLFDREKETIHEFLLQDSEGILRVAFYHEPEAGGAYWVVWIWDQP
jgi:hypothetical protein